MLKSGVIPESKRIQKNGDDEEERSYPLQNNANRPEKRRNGILNMFFSSKKKPEKIKHLYTTESMAKEQENRMSSMQDFANFTNEC